MIMTDLGAFGNWRPKNSKISAFDEYLVSLKAGFMKDSKYTESIWKNFETHLTRHFGRIQEFLDSDETIFKNLVLGNVQSGKTGHLISSIAWAYDNEFDLVILLNGNKHTLNAQTSKRVDKALGTRIKLTSVQTLAAKAYETFTEELEDLIVKRQQPGAPLPVAVLIKNASRLDGLSEGIENVIKSANLGNLRVLVLDDEADQVSPDANTANAGKKPPSDKAVHQALLRLSKRIPGKLTYLYYTATPQALLAQNRSSLLQPSFCSIVPSGPSYFGLRNLLGTETACKSLEKLGANPSSLDYEEKQDEILETAFIEFLAHAWLHATPDLRKLFHSGNSCSAKSVQMLIHPSGTQQQHRDFAKKISTTRKDFLAALSNEKDCDELIRSYLKPEFDRLTEGLGLDKTDGDLAGSFMDFIFDLLKDESKLRIRIVNTDQKMLLDASSVGADFLPTEDDEWDVAPAWVLVGGDILGRGLTIPHLVSTFFLRDPKFPTFDTAVQQMRFCGYRDSYKHLVRVYAPNAIFVNYRDILESDLFLREMANAWDSENRNLKHNPPKFVHLKPKATRVKMTRRSVTSVHLRSSSNAKRSGFTRIESSQDFNDFSKSIKNLEAKLGALPPASEGFCNLPNQDLFEILETISGDRELPVNALAVSGVLQDTKLASEVFGKDVKVAVELPDGVGSFGGFMDLLPDLVELGTSGKEKSLSYRSTSADLEKDFEYWFANKQWVPNSDLKELVGDSERRVRDKYPEDAVLLIKPIALTDSSKNIKALTLTAVLWVNGDSPDFVVHTEGAAD
jgi:hypothetical protein